MLKIIRVNCILKMFSNYNINVSNNIIDLTYNNGIDYTESKFAKNAHYYFGTNIYKIEILWSSIIVKFTSDMISALSYCNYNNIVLPKTHYIIKLELIDKNDNLDKLNIPDCHLYDAINKDFIVFMLKCVDNTDYKYYVREFKNAYLFISFIHT